MTEAGSSRGPSPAVDARIREVRVADVVLTVRGSDGAPIRDADVAIEQRSHQFGFGCAAFDVLPLANGELDDAAAGSTERRFDDWLGLFNTATLPFYWGRFEPVRGHPDSTRLANAARWLVDRGVRVKGHPLCWHTVTADWLLALTDDEIVAAQLDRISREVGGFAGLIDTWDVVNEAVIMPVFDRYDNGITRAARHLGQVELVRATFEAARSANPGATLLLNDFDMSAAYEDLVERCLDAGVAIDALGLQSHMHQGAWGEEKTLGILDRFARFGVPLHLTETTLLSGELMPPEIVDLNDYQVADWPSTPEGEARQADEVVRHYRTLVSHPAVEAVTWWDFRDGAWLNAPSGLVRRDGSRKPGYEALHRLVKGDWWLPPTTLRTADDGTVRFSGFLGTYGVSRAGEAAVIGVDRPGACALETMLSERVR